MEDFDYRCWNCDSRWCYDGGCEVPGNVYVVGHGWASPTVARVLEQSGRTVHWYEVVQ